MNPKIFNSIVVSLLIGGTVGAHGAKADFRNVKVYVSQSYQLEYSIGAIQTASVSAGKPNGGWSPIPFGVKNPSSITGGTNLGDTWPMTSSESIVLSEGAAIRFALEISTNDTGISATSYADDAPASVDLVDASNGTVLATMCSMSTVQNANWTSGKAMADYFDVPSSLAGHTAYVRLTVGWNGSGTPTYDAWASTGSDGLAYAAILGTVGKQVGPASPIASDIQLTNSPNPVVNYTSIDVRNMAEVSSLKVYDVLGREIADLTGSLTSASVQQVRFDATNLVSGNYFYRLSSAVGVVQRQMIVKH